MFDLKTRALLHHTTSKKKEVYKRRIMIGDVLTNKKVYVDLPDDYYKYNSLSEPSSNRDIIVFQYKPNEQDNYISTSIYETNIHDPYLEIEAGTLYTPCVPNKIYSAYASNEPTDQAKDEYNHKEIIFKPNCSNVTEVLDGPAYRHFWIEDKNIRPVKVGDALKNGTKLYFNIPDNITKLFSEYKYTSSTRSKVSSKTPILKATPSTPDPTTDTLINKFLKVTYYPDGTERRASVTNLILTDGSSNIDIFKATYNQSDFYKPEINISTYTVTNTTVISDYNEFDFWSQFILVDETTL